LCLLNFILFFLFTELLCNLQNVKDINNLHGPYTYNCTNFAIPVFEGIKNIGHLKRNYKANSNPSDKSTS
jgi:hypothetical protein